MTGYAGQGGSYRGATSRQGSENESHLKGWEVHAKQMYPPE